MIKNRTKFVLTVGIGLSLFSGLSQAMFLKKGANDRTLLIPNPSAPARLGALALIHDDEGFSVLNKSEIRRIPNHLVARDLRGIPQSEVTARLDNNINFRVQQGSDGEFSLQECGGLKGGGWKDWWPFNSKPMGTAAVDKAVWGTGVILTGLGLYNGTPRFYDTFRARTPEEQTELDYFKHKQDLNQCLLTQDQGAERDANGFPLACTEELRKFAIVAKSPAEVDDIVNAVRKFSKKN